MRSGLLIILLSVCLNSLAQDTSIFKYPIAMDEVVIRAQSEGFDVAAFIKRVQNDTTFYKAFKSMRVVSYEATNDIRVLNSRGKVKSSYYSVTKQKAWNGCRTMKVLEEKVKGDFFKKDREYRYYTAELYDYLFFTKDTICGQNDIVDDGMDERESGQLGKHKHKLKQLIFNPGSKVAGVPLMGDKAAIFDEDIAPMYDFKIESEMYDGEDCYVFKAIPKAYHKEDVVIKNLVTWFRKSDYSIVARDYSLSYDVFAYDFDVRMKVRTREVGGKLLPVRIDYYGNWHVLTKKRERVNFSTTIVY